MSWQEGMARLGRDLRAAGVRVALGDEADALAALAVVDAGDRHEVRLALRCALKIRPRDAAAFEAIFAGLWRAPSQAPAAGHGPGRPPVPLFVPSPEVEPDDDAEPSATREVLLRRKPFERCDERDLREMEPLVARLARTLATRRGRRLVPAPRGRADPRRSFRRALGTGGEMLSLARRDRPLEHPRLVFLMDTSGSMAPQTRFLVALARALARVARGTEVFAFNTELVRITPWLSSGNLAVVLARLAQVVPDWAGGTRIGESLDAFVRDHLSALVDSRTVVVVFSDGLERGDPNLIAVALRRIRARARRVIWLNPLLADARYEPTARGMAAALPYLDRLAPAHDLASLERIVPELGL